MHEHIINTPIKDLPPSGSDFLESMYFHSLSFRRDKQRLAVHWTWKNKPFFIVYSKS